MCTSALWCASYWCCFFFSSRRRHTRCSRDWSSDVCSSDLDIGKPETFADGHFHQHEFVGEFKARQILRRWKFDKETVAEVTHLIRHHMFWYETHWTDSAVRRFIRTIGLDYIPALFALRRADNIG